MPLSGRGSSEWDQYLEEPNVYYDEDGSAACNACGAYAADDEERNDTDTESEGELAGTPELQAYLGSFEGATLDNPKHDYFLARASAGIMRENTPAVPDSFASGPTAGAEARERDAPEKEQAPLTGRAGFLRAASVPAFSPEARVCDASRVKEKEPPSAPMGNRSGALAVGQPPT